MSEDEAVKTGATSIVMLLDKSSRIVMTFMVELEVEVGPRVIVSGVEW